MSNTTRVTLAVTGDLGKADETVSVPNWQAKELKSRGLARDAAARPAVKTTKQEG